MVWSAVSAGATSISVVVAQRVVTFVWRRVHHGGAPPEGPADQKVTWGAALTWAVALGIGIAVARLIAIRLSEDVWEATTHEEPPKAT